MSHNGEDGGVASGGAVSVWTARSRRTAPGTPAFLPLTAERRVPDRLPELDREREARRCDEPPELLTFLALAGHRASVGCLHLREAGARHVCSNDS
jgi:hypothetical protein